MSLRRDRAKVSTATTGTGTVTLGSAVVPFQSFASAGLLGTTRRYSYLIEDGNAWEVGEGVYDAGAGTMTRNLIASSTAALLNLTGAATIAISEKASDQVQVIEKKVFAGGETSFSFTDIPQDFTSLEIEVFWRSTVNAAHSDTQWTANGLTTAIYDRQRMWKTGTGTALSNSDSLLGSTSFSWIPILGTNYPASQAQGAVLRLLGYTTALHKVFRFTSYKYPNSTSTFDQLIMEGTGGIRTTSAITSIECATLPSSHALAAGSYAVLRGIP